MLTARPSRSRISFAGQMREITKLQGRDARVAVWERMKSTHQLVEWQKVQFSTVWLT
jgi:hypothetical protein